MSLTGDRIHERREKLGYSVDQLCKMIGKDRATLFRYENGSIKEIPISILPAIAEVLHTSPVYLCGWTDNPDLSLQEIMNITDPLQVDLFRKFDALTDDAKDQVLAAGKALKRERTSTEGN